MLTQGQQHRDPEVLWCVNTLCGTMAQHHGSAMLQAPGVGGSLCFQLCIAYLVGQPTIGGFIFGGLMVMQHDRLVA